MIQPADLDLIKARKKQYRLDALVERLTPLTTGQWRALNEHPDAKVRLAQAFGDPELFAAYLKKPTQG